MATTKDEDRERSEMVAEVKGRDGPVGELRGLRDAAKAAAVKARDLLSGEAGGTDRRQPETEEPGRQKLEEMRLRATGQHEEAQRGMEAKDNIVSSIGSVTDAIKEKLTQPTDVVNETRLAHEHGAALREDPTAGPTGSEHIPPGAA
ncbi:late embryogenesis abundant protein ECP63-like [Punica granatum]|uniref:Uncharacterized protein n=2 Tax=Punica granatum TaxID=22663 RepID=A0A218W9U8_PUNGR|nr:late embryogenesis abundant protein ECP63-like [Punica granatum]OWM69657.1 hypothetical protein CDL15_Pgr025506 [Punica granatum]PKI57662.1 hypothetical protein CRG98_021990 [Punica granatum]